MDSLQVAEHQPATAVSSSSVGRFLPALSGQQLVVCTSDCLVVYQTCEHDDGLQLIDSVPLLDVFQAAVTIPASSQSQPDLLLLLSIELAQVALVQLQCVPGSTQHTSLVTHRVLASATVPPPSGGKFNSKSMYGVRSSKVFAHQDAYFLALAMYMDSVHVLRVVPASPASSTSSYTIDIAETTLSIPANSAPGGYEDTGSPVCIHDLELLPAWDNIAAQKGSLTLALITDTSGIRAAHSLDVQMMEVVVMSRPSASGSSGQPPQPHMQLDATMFKLVHQDPTTRLLHAVPASRHSPAGLLLISQYSIRHLPASKEDKHSIVARTAYSMPGLPVCLEVLHEDEQGRQVILVADSLAGLHLIYWGYQDTCQVTPVTSSGPLSVASTLSYLPAATQPDMPPPASAGCETGAGSASQEVDAALVFSGVLFLGSSSSNSQALAVPVTAMHVKVSDCLNPDASAQPAGGAQAAVPADSVQFSLLDAALIKSLAPVSCCEVVEDKQEAGDATLLLGCGAAPFGRLAKAKLGMALVPYQPSSTTLPETAQLFPITGSPGQEAMEVDQQPQGSSTTHLAFTFSASGHTHVLSLEGSVFRQVDLPGLRSDAASLLIQSLAGKTLVQVTADEVRVLAAPPSTQLLHTWTPPGSHSALHISHAAAEQNIVAVCTNSHIHTVQISNSAPPVVLSSLATPQSASSLNLVAHPEAAGQVPVAIWGQWVDSKLVLAPADNLAQPLLVVDLLGHTARSAAMLPLPCGRWALAAGTNNGTVLIWELHLPRSSSTAWTVGPTWAVQASNVAVRLSVASQQQQQGHSRGPGGCWPYLYAHSGQGAVIQLLPHLQDVLSASGTTAAAAADLQGLQVLELLQVCRVHGSTWLSAACQVHAAGMMPNSWAWVTSSNQLMFGSLDMDLRMRWTTAMIGDTPHHVCQHEASNSYVMLSEDAAGAQTLRLVHGQSLLPLMSMRLADDHRYSSLLVTPLPCSSSSKLQTTSALASVSPKAASTPSPTTQPKQFVVLASHKMCDPPGQSAAASARPASARQPPPQQTVGLLSFFEVVVNRSHDSGGTHVSYQLLLHGTCPSPAVATSIAVATPITITTSASKTQGKEHSQSAVRDAAQETDSKTDSDTSASDLLVPHLLAGCQDGIRVYHIHVEDVQDQVPRDVQHVLKAVSLAPPPANVAALPPGALRLAALADELEAGGEAGEAAAHRLVDLLIANAHRRLMPDFDWGAGGDGSGDDDEDDDDNEGGDDHEVGSLPDARHMSALQAWLHPNEALPAGDPRVAAVSGMQQAMTRDWNQHVALKQVAHARTHAGFAVTQLRVQGSLVFASDFLGSVTLLQLRLKPGKQQHPATVELMPLSAVHLPVYTPAALPLNSNQLLAGVHPGGLAVMRRDQQAEAAALAAAQQRAATRAQQGRGDVEHEFRHTSLITELTPFDVSSACRVRHDIRHLLPVRLGLHLEPAQGQQGAATSATGSATSASCSAAPGNVSHVTAVAADGSVLGVRVVSEAGSDERTKALLGWQDALDRAGPQLGLTPHAGSWALCVGSKASMASVLETQIRQAQQLPGACVDIAFLKAGLRQGLGTAGGTAALLSKLHL